MTRVSARTPRLGRTTIAALRVVSVFFRRVALLPVRLLFGHDFFISYARSDGALYAGALTERLNAEFRARIDAQEAEAGDKTSMGLRWSIVRSRVLVVVATPAAIASQHVLDEVRLFRRWGGASPQVLVEDTEIVRSVREFRGLPFQVERGLTADAGPSEVVIRQLARAVGYWKVSRRQAVATVALAALLIGSGIGTYLATKAAASAEKERASAVTARGIAEEAARNATSSLVQTRSELTETSNRADAEEARAEKATQAANAASAQLNQRNAELATTNNQLTAVRSNLSNTQTALTSAEKARDETNVLRRNAITGAMTANAFRVRSSLGNLTVLRDAVANLLQASSRWKDDTDAFPEEVSASLVDALAQAKRGGLPLGPAGAWIRDFDVAPNGHLVVAIGPDQPFGSPQPTYSATLWDVPSNESLGKLLTSDVEMTAVAMSPDSRTIAVGFASGAVKLLALEPSSTRQSRNVQLPGSCGGIRFTASGKSLLALASGQASPLVRIDVADGGLVTLPFEGLSSKLVLPIAEQGFQALQQAPEVFGVFNETSVTLTTVHVDSREPPRHFPLTAGPIKEAAGDLSSARSFAVSPDGTLALVAPSRGNPRETALLDLACLTERRPGCTPVFHFLREDVPPGDERSKMGFSSDSRFFVVPSRRTGVDIYPTRRSVVLSAGQPRSFLRDPRFSEFENLFRILGFALAADELIVDTGVGPSDGLATEHLTSRGTLLSTGRLSLDLASRAYVNSVKEAHRGALLIALTSNGLVTWERRQAPGTSFAQGHGTIDSVTRATDMAVAPDDSWIATAHESGDVVLWNPDDRTLAGTIKGAGQGALIAWSQTTQGPALYIASVDGRLSRWGPRDAAVTDLASSTVDRVTDLAVSADGRTALMSGDSNSVAIWRDGTSWTMDLGFGTRVAVAKAGDRFVVIREDGSGDVIDIASRKPIVALERPSGPWVIPAAVQFALSDTRIVAGAGADPIVAWDALSGQLLRRNAPPASSWSAATHPPDRLFVNYRQRDIEVVDLADGRRVAGFTPSDDLFWYPGAASFDVLPSAGLVASAVRDASATDPNAIVVWKLHTGKPVAVIPRQGPVARLQFMPRRNALVLLPWSGVPTLLPFEVQGQLQALCPLLMSDRKPLFAGETNPAPPYLCADTFAQVSNSSPLVAPRAGFVLRINRAVGPN